MPTTVGYVTAEDFDTEAQAIIRPSAGNTSRQAWWTATLNRCLQAAYGLIRRTLSGRGFNPAQIAAWADGAEYQVSHALYLLTIRARLDIKPEIAASVKDMDMTERLLTAPVTDADGNMLTPLGFTAPVAGGQMKTGSELFPAPSPADGDDRRDEDAIHW